MFSSSMYSFNVFVVAFLQGVIEDRIGYFPAAFAHLVQVGDRVFRCNRTFIGCKEQGQITLKEGQVLHKLNDDGTLGQCCVSIFFSSEDAHQNNETNKQLKATKEPFK